MKDGGDGEGAVRFETRGMCLKFWCQLPVREIWHPIKPQVRSVANRAPQNKVPKFQTLGQVFEVKGGSRRPHCPVTSRFRFAEKVCLPQAVRKTRAGVDRCSDTLRHHG